MAGWYDWPGFVVVLLMGAVVCALATRRLPAPIAALLWVGFGLRVIGSIARYEVIFTYYEGVADATGYYNHGLRYANSMWAGDLDFLDEGYWFGGTPWNTQFVRYVSGIVLAVIGPTTRGEFLAFALVSYSGLVLTASAFHEVLKNDEATRRFSLWVFAWPSLWFWPSGVGKEALVLFGLGVMTWAYVGRDGRARWLALVPAIAFVGAVRPHIGAIALVSVGVAEVVREMRPGARLLQVLCVLVVLPFALDPSGEVEMADRDSFEEFVVEQANRTATGGSVIEGSAGLTAIPLGVVNVLMRPFPWEAHNIFSLLAAAETMGFWWLAWQRRRRIREALRTLRRNRLLAIALPCAGLLTVGLGLVVFNLGILVRQRVIILPALMALLEVLPPAEADEEAPEVSVTEDTTHPVRAHLP